MRGTTFPAMKQSPCWPFQLHYLRCTNMLKAEDGYLDAHLEAQPFKTPDEFLDMPRLDAESFRSSDHDK